MAVSEDTRRCAGRAVAGGNSWAERADLADKENGKHHWLPD